MKHPASSIFPFATASSTDPIDSLRACHDRIRTFTSGLERVAALPDLADPRVPAAAAQAHRYLNEGLPLHAADEDRSLAPRLRLVVPRSVALFDALAEDHLEIDVRVAALSPLLLRLGVGEAVDRGAFGVAVSALNGLLLPHILLEEDELFPMGAELSPEDRAAIVREIAARRA